jgi:molybdopterin/thiamine biosynthesis adenylyltransferase
MLADSETRDIEAEGVSLVVAGLGNIGSFLAPHLARMEGVSCIVLCDPDAYEPGQQIGQDIPADAVGRNKAEVQAARLRAIRPELHVESFAAPIEDLPLGRLHRAIAVSCLDSRTARLHLASRAWRVSSPFVDAAVGGGSSLLVRTNVYVPSASAACFECSFEPSDYAALEQVFPCDEKTTRSNTNTLVADGTPESRSSAGPTSA